MSDPRFKTWRKATKSSDGNNCVQVSLDVPETVAIRDSKLGDASPVLVFTADEFMAFADGVSKGEFALPS
jgi:hypothetical protein